jgi:hypothetical protein
VKEDDTVDGPVLVRWREGELGQMEKVKGQRERGRWASGEMIDGLEGRESPG